TIYIGLVSSIKFATKFLRAYWQQKGEDKKY
ncbi:MAG: hypothetical protein ACJATA_001350, partial [Sphingobacteriales bacterium]